MTSKRSSSVLIGDLLVKSELITLGQLADAIPISQKTGLPVGRVLVSAGFITDDRLQQALLAQSLIRDKFLTVDLATLALKKVKETGLPLDLALKEVGWRSEYFDFTNKLGQLLVDSEIVSVEMLDESLQTCFSTGLPLGRILVLKGVLNELLAYAALTAQVLVRDGKVTRDQAIDALKSASRRKLTLEESLEFHGYLRIQPSNTIRLGELLVLAELVTEIDLVSAVEKGLIDEQPIGQVLVQSKLISYSTLVEALKVQELVSAQILNPLEAVEVLLLTRERGISIPEAVTEVTRKKEKAVQQPQHILTLPELIKLVRLVPHDELQKAFEMSKESGTPVENVLLVNNFIDTQTLNVAQRCHHLLQQGYITAEQAIFALHYWVWSNEDFNDVIGKLGWVQQLSGKTQGLNP